MICRVTHETLRTEQQLSESRTAHEEGVLPWRLMNEAAAVSQKFA